MIIELHLLQSFPVSNLNRDDLGQPKTATFGGCVRGRVSSQCLKRSARLLLAEYGLAEDETGIRTKRLVTRAAERLASQGRDQDEAIAVVKAGLTELGFGVDNTLRTQYLLFVGRQAVELLADYCAQNWNRLAERVAKTSTKADTSKDGNTKGTTNKNNKTKPDKDKLAAARRILDASRVVDVALFGRMIADNKDFNVDAASQVAHAISTHPVVNEFDYYTAVDDIKPDDQPGADMIGTVDFNSACYYRYANLDLDQLSENLGGDTDLVNRSTTAWLHAFINAVPSGKQNSMAARTLPETLLGVVRERGAWNLANAFLRPVTGPDLMAESTSRLLGHFDQLQRFYGRTGVRTAVAASVTGEAPSVAEVSEATTIDEFTAQLTAAARA